MIDLRLIALVTRREVTERLRLRSFRIFTAAIFLLTAAGIVAIDSGPQIFGEDEATLGLVEPPAYEGLATSLEQASERLDLKLEIRRFADREAATAALSDDDIDAFLAGEELVFDDDEDEELVAVVNAGLYQARLPQLLAELNISEADASRLLNPEPVEVTLVDPEGAEEDDEDVFFMSFIATVALYGTIVMYGNWILTGVIEEKASRVVEVLLGIVQPQDLLAGKTLGILLVALLQLAAAVAGAVLGLLLIGTTDFLPPVAGEFFAVTAPYLITGIVLYSLIFAVVGSTVGRQSEAQSAAAPITLSLLAPYMLSLTYIPQEPDSALSVLLSVFPLTSPLTMPTRVALGSPTVIEIGGGLVLLALTIAAVAWLGGRAYAGAILSGRRVSWSQLLQTLRVKR